MKLILKIERLTELSQDELTQAVAGAPGTYTGRPGCILSWDPCVTFLCTALCNAAE